MFERQLYQNNLSSSQYGQELLDNFLKAEDVAGLISNLCWEEHCTECTMPTCFTTCSFYKPREDFKCNRFENGICVVEDDRRVLFEGTFKKWGKLEAKGRSGFGSIGASKSFNSFDRLLAKFVTGFPFLGRLRPWLLRRYNTIRSRLADKLAKSFFDRIDGFLIEIANLQDEDINGYFTIRNEEGGQRFFQKNLKLTPGYHRVFIPVSEITNVVSLSKSYLCTFEPLTTKSDAKLLFGRMDFVGGYKDQPAPQSQPKSEKTQAKKAKCVVWDLDHTLWEGVLIEDGPENIKLRQDVIEFIKELDSRGILNSVVSKNNFEDAEEVLKKFGLFEYFLYPQISWGPKSQAIANIQKALNIGIDTFVFVDDQVFEREEVATSHPDVRIFDIVDFEKMKSDDAFDVVKTTESSRRRQYYMDQIERDQYLVSDASQNEYLDFLKDCQIKVDLFALDESNLQRAFELAQRTNQMNFSGKRYSLEELRALIANEDVECTLIKCSDRFGDYGIIGLSIFEVSEKTVSDLMFSCRIQSKYVDYAVLENLINEHKDLLKIRYQQTGKNQNAAKIFDDIGFVVTSEQGESKVLSLPQGFEVSRNEIVEVNHL